MADASVELVKSGSHAADNHDAPDGHGEVEVASHAHVQRYNPEAPSEEWGWHGSWREFAPKGSRALLWLFTLGMFVMMIGNHVSHVENWYLGGIGVLMAIWLLRGEIKIRRDRKSRP